MRGFGPSGSSAEVSIDAWEDLRNEKCQSSGVQPYTTSRDLESKMNDRVNIRECYVYGLKVFSTEGWTADFYLNMPRSFCLFYTSLSSRHLEVSCMVSLYTGLTILL